MFQKPFQLIWRCPKKYLSVRIFKGNFSRLENYRVLFEPSESFSYPDGSCRKFEDTEKTYFYQKILGEVFRYTCAYRNFAKILGNINAYPNIIGVKLNNLIVLDAQPQNNFSDNMISRLMPVAQSPLSFIRFMYIPDYL